MKSKLHSAIFAAILRSAALCFPLVLVACGGTHSSSTSTSNPITNPPPVSAQTTYSNSALSGTYSISIIAVNSNGGGDGLGTAQFDGNGNITAVSLTSFSQLGVPTPCQFTGTGTYSVNSNASGTASISISTTGSVANCGPTLSPLAFNLEAAQQGASFLLTENDGKQLATVSGLKQ